MTQIAYTVICRIDFETKIEEWLDWLRNGHIDEVISCGAQSAEIVRHDKEDLVEIGATFEIRYKFENREAIDQYLENHAIRLRQEGLDKFPVSDGFHYKRVIGEIIT